MYKYQIISSLSTKLVNPPYSLKMNCGGLTRIHCIYYIIHLCTVCVYIYVHTFCTYMYGIVLRTLYVVYYVQYVQSWLCMHIILIHIYMYIQYTYVYVKYILCEWHYNSDIMTWNWPVMFPSGVHGWVLHSLQYTTWPFALLPGSLSLILTRFPVPQSLLQLDHVLHPPEPAIIDNCTSLLMGDHVNIVQAYTISLLVLHCFKVTFQCIMISSSPMQYQKCCVIYVHKSTVNCMYIYSELYVRIYTVKLLWKESLVIHDLALLYYSRWWLLSEYDFSFHIQSKGMTKNVTRRSSTLWNFPVTDLGIEVTFIKRTPFCVPM